MTERGIIFSGTMVQAILENRKTQTRRLSRQWLKVRKGDRLWVREAHAFVSPTGDPAPVRDSNIQYRADKPDAKYPGEWDDAIDPKNETLLRWKHSLYMPRWASRIDLEATEDARLEFLDDIRSSDCRAEGVDGFASWRFLWNYLHTKPGTRWEDNPELVVLTFRRVVA